MSFDEFLVFTLEGINISDDVDIDNTGLGYVCFMHINCAQLRFFECFYEKVTYPFIISIRKKINPNFVSENEIIPDGQAILLWGDSDIPYLKQLTRPELMEQSLNKV